MGDNIKYKKAEDKIGEVRLNTRGTPMKLIVYRHSLDCDVQFQDKYGYIFEHAIYQNFLKGQIKNPYDITVHGVGMIGDGKYKTFYDENNVRNPDYVCWVDVLKRCYVDKKNFPAYYGTTIVCEEWHNYQNFAEWYFDNAYNLPNDERLHLDKDILIPGNKIYSPETCIFVPQSINMLFSNMTRKDGLPNGIQQDKNTGRYRAMYNIKHLGTFGTLEDAYFEYAQEKESAIRQKADEYKNYIPDKLYTALLDYKVKIDYDKNYTA